MLSITMLEKTTKFTVKTGKATSSLSVLNAIDRAMLDAEIGDLNIIEVSSVLPKDIEKVEKISGKTGDFRHAVLSKATGSDKRLIAGLAWGFREDDQGGYVIEHFAEEEKFDMDDFKEELRGKLKEMGEARGVTLKDVNMVYDNLDVREEEFGCVIAGLVYLP